MNNLINRDVAIMTMRNMANPDEAAVFETILRNIPAVEAEPVRHGRWIARRHRKFNSQGQVIDYCDFYHCSECKSDRCAFPPHNYCCNCGAKMDGDINV